MKNSYLTMYLLADGTHANPADCEPDEDGVLRHIYGTHVAMRDDGEPMTVGQGAVDNMNVKAAELGEQAAATAEEQGGVDDVQPEAEPGPAEPAAPAAEPPSSEAKEMTTEEPVTAPKPAPKETAPPPPRKYKNRQLKGK